MIPVEPLLTVQCAEEATGMRGFLVIHSLGNGRTVGGVRAAPDVTLEEVGLLARAMTYKYAFWERPSGGAKAGLVLSAGASPVQRRQAFNALGRHLAPLLRTDLYQPWTDLNCSPADVADILAGAGLAAANLPDSSYHTALTVFAAVKAAAEFLGIGPGACRIGIEGLGRVGTHLARELAAWGGKLIAASTAEGAVRNESGLDADTLARAREAHGDAFVGRPGEWERLSRDDLFRVPLDIIVPCARTGSINGATARTLEAKAVVPGANAPCTEEAEALLTRRGVMVLPDFVCNSGGVMGSRLEGFGVSESTLRELVINRFGAMVARMLRQSAERAVSPAALARGAAEGAYARLSARAARTAGAGTVPPWTVPSRLVRRLARLVPRPYRRWQACRDFLRIADARFETADR